MYKINIAVAMTVLSVSITGCGDITVNQPARRVIVEKPVVIEKTIVEKPVVIEKTVVEKPVIVEKTTVEKPVILIEKR